LLSKAFTRSRVEALRPRVGEIVDGLLDRVVAESAGGEMAVDMVPLFTEQVPTAVICELFGIPQPRRSQLRGWTQTLFSQVSPPEEIYAAQQDLVAYLGELVEEKRHNPGEDLTTALVRAHHDEDSLSSQELVDSLFLLLIAGHETTVHLLGHAIVNLLGHRDQLARARAAGLWENVVEETLRLNPPVSGSVFRYALEPVEVAGVSIPAGDPLLLCIGGAATDTEHHGPDADTFDITREQRGHMAFGHGVHMCLGAPLARLEANVALSKLFGRLPEMKEAVSLDDIPYSPSFLTYGPLSIPVLPGTPA
jgi:cytochrome P450